MQTRSLFIARIGQIGVNVTLSTIENYIFCTIIVSSQGDSIEAW